MQYVLLKGLLYFIEHLNMEKAYCIYCALLHLAESCQRHCSINFLLFRGINLSGSVNYSESILYFEA